MKILELSDLHLDPKWIEAQKPCLNKIIETGKKEKPDFICIAGDFSNRPFYNSDKDSISFVRRFVKDLLKIAPVVMITGTPAHDAPGSYGIFEDLGCHVIKPNKPEIINDVLFIGLPEIDKISLMTRSKLSMEEANASIMKSLNNFMDRYWKPVREANKDKPCIFMGHGVFVDDLEKSKSNPIIKNSDFVIDNRILKTINADRYIFGHFHTPEESKILNGGYVGYAGFDKTPWNNTGFQPGFNLTKLMKRGGIAQGETLPITDYVPIVTRIPYPVTRREKRNIKYNPNMKLNTLAQWHHCDVRLNMEISKSDLRKIDIEEMQQKYVDDFSLNSCLIVPQLIREESDRITVEQAEELNTDWKKYCFFKKWEKPEDPGHKSVYLKFTEMIDNVLSRSISKEKKDVYLLDATIHGSIFSKDAHNKDTLYYDFSNDPKGLTLLSGDNGKCKSTYLGFLLPYPYFVGFDYRTLKEFFILDDSYIKKNFMVNGQRHQHLIYIPEKKGIKCYWNVETETGELKSFMETDKLSDFMEACEKYYGPMDSFISTCFHAQEPHRMSKYVSSLASSSSTELRNAYMKIIGIDREGEREYAKLKKKSIESEIHDLETQKNTMNDFIVDNDTVYEEKKRLESEIEKLEKEINKIRVEEKHAEQELKNNTIKKEKQDKIKTELEIIKGNLNNLNFSIIEKQTKLKEFESINIEELKKQIADNETVKAQLDKTRDDWKGYSEAKQKIEKEIAEIQEKINNKNNELKDHKNKIENNNLQIKNYEKENELLNKKCFHCGKNPNPESEQKINDNSHLIDQYKAYNKGHEELIAKKEKESAQLETEIHKFDESIYNVTLNLENITDEGNKLKAKLLSLEKIQAINNKLDECKDYESLKKSISEIETEIKKLSQEIDDKTKTLNPFITIQYEKSKTELNKVTTELNNKNNELSKQTGLLEAIKNQIVKIEKYKTELEVILKALDEKVIDLTEWEGLYFDMAANKFPALELDLITKEIDFEVNKTLNEKFIIETKTQYINDKGELIDGFSINVYNPQSGIEKELLKHSPGQRATYFNEPIMEALRKRRQQREGVVFHWSILDEADNPIKSEHILDYYMMMNNAIGDDHTRFVVSQKSEAYGLIKNTIEIDKVACDSPG